jgi:hypothetical protein
MCCCARRQMVCTCQPAQHSNNHMHLFTTLLVGYTTP